MKYKVYHFDVKGYRRSLWTVLLLGLLFAGLPATAQPAAGSAAQPAFGAEVAIASPSSIAPGDPLLCWILSGREAIEAKATLTDASGRRIAGAESFYMPPQGEGFLYGFLVPVPVKAPTGPAHLLISLGHNDGRSEYEAEILIESKKFMKEDIPLDKANTALRTQPDPAKTAETNAFAAIFQARDPTAIFAAGLMVKPLAVPWRETAGFADERRYLYDGGGSDSILHGGIDLGAKEGSDVFACAAGRVVFADRRIVTGNTIVIEHLPGLFSLYMHLSSIGVAEGQEIDQGRVIGRVGSTGLSTGPHLHWEMRIGSVSVNPYYWLSQPFLAPPSRQASPLDKAVNSSKIKPPAEGR